MQPSAQQTRREPTGWRALLLPICFLVSSLTAGCNGGGTNRPRADGGADSAVGESPDQATATGAELGSDFGHDSTWPVEVRPNQDMSVTGDMRGAPDVAGARDTAVPPDSAGASDASWPTACVAYAQAFCAIKIRCTAYTFHRDYGTAEQCEARFGGNNCTTWMSSPGSKVTPADLVACAAALSTETCAQWFVSTPPECGVKGSLSDGAKCAYDQQCQSGFCDIAPGALCGPCQTKARLGESCSHFLRECENGMRCANPSGDTVEWVCTVPGGEGASCSGDDECSWGLVCINDRCVRAKGLGEQCSGRECDLRSDLMCLSVAGSSGAACGRVSYPAPGEACDEAAAIVCGSSADCKGTSGSAKAGVCSAAREDGAACDSSSDCLVPAQCLDGTCKSPANVVGSCQ